MHVFLDTTLGGCANNWSWGHRKSAEVGGLQRFRLRMGYVLFSNEFHGAVVAVVITQTSHIDTNW